MEPTPQEMQRTMEKTSESVLNEINEKYLRKIQATGYECASKCYIEPFSSSRTDENCVRKCLGPSEKAVNMIEVTVNEYHQSLTDCIKACHSAVNIDSSPIEAREKQFFACSGTCVNSFVSRSKGVTNKCLDMLSQMK